MKKPVNSERLRYITRCCCWALGCGACATALVFIGNLLELPGLNLNSGFVGTEFLHGLFYTIDDSQEVLFAIAIFYFLSAVIVIFFSMLVLSYLHWLGIASINIFSRSVDVQIDILSSRHLLK